jgi:transglutaminase-like putative cysteine protease
MSTLRASHLIANTAFAVLATAVAACAFWPVYKDFAFVSMVVVTLALGAAIALFGAVFRWPSIVMAGVTVLGFLLFGVPLAIPSEAALGFFPTPASIVQLVQASALSWKQLVTISVPVGSYEALLVPAFILILLAIVVSLTIALRAKHTELAVIPPLLVFVAAILLGPAESTLPVVFGLANLAVALVWLIWFRRRRHSESIRLLAAQSPVGGESRRDRRAGGVRTALGAAGIIAIAALAGTAATTMLPTQSPRDVVRTSIQQPFDPRNYPSPLSAFRAYLEPANATRAMVTVSGVPADRHIRIATLDTYNGVVYSVGNSTTASASGSFTRLPYRLSQQGVKGVADTIEVAVEGYSGVWVPGSGQLQDVTFSGPDAQALTGSFYYNDTSGSAAVTTGLHSGDSYVMHTIVKPELTAAQLADQSPGPAVLPNITVVPDELDATIQQYSASAKTAGGKLAAALKQLAANGYISHGIGNEPPSASGHGADRITQLLTDIPMIGDQEQYAVTAALMARQLGFPARVVFGFVAPADASLSQPITFTGSNISAWIEVQTKADGWVTVDPNPPVRPVPPKQPQTPNQITRPQTEVQPPVGDSLTQNNQAPPSHVDNNNANTPNPILEFLLAALITLGWSLLVIAIIASPFLAIIGAKWRRRSLRRSAPTSIERISGGWREFSDTAVDHGFEPPASATRTELASTVGAGGALALAARTDRAVFSSDTPSAEEAAAVWDDVGELRRVLNEGRSRWGRFRALISLRSLGVYRGRSGRSKGGQ